MIFMEKVRRGKERIDPDVLKLAKAAAKRKRKEYGRGITHVMSDFNWGYMQGKFSAVRWVLGEEWDFLDT
jgi:hypothetical protein